ncbi:MAG: hypothetical protein FJ008_02890 [Chloroflexi bacterium]|nr:hypothetical protein [Chloroflexota bacterium]MBM3172218.1 hypothetical protein [Chloroflexota bacterium]MBM3174210.1 hypothetical protein [Chloroflexota bacterium]MBM4449903.1 hypothetical protein [Chloroflexota bacterium]
MDWYIVVSIVLGIFALWICIVAAITPLLNKRQRENRKRMSEERREFFRKQAKELTSRMFEGRNKGELETEALEYFAQFDKTLLSGHVYWYVIRDRHTVGIGSDTIKIPRSRYRIWGPYKSFGAAVFSSNFSGRGLYPSLHGNKWQALNEFKWKEQRRLLPENDLWNDSLLTELE